MVGGGYLYRVWVASKFIFARKLKFSRNTARFILLNPEIQILKAC